MVAAEKIQARLALGALSLLAETKRQEITLREYAKRWLATPISAITSRESGSTMRIEIIYYHIEIIDFIEGGL